MWVGLGRGRPIALFTFAPAPALDPRFLVAWDHMWRPTIQECHVRSIQPHETRGFYLRLTGFDLASVRARRKILRPLCSLLRVLGAMGETCMHSVGREPDARAPHIIFLT